MDDYRREYNEPGRTDEDTPQTGMPAHSRITEKAEEIRAKVADFGRKAIDSVDQSRHPAAAALDSTATTLHSGGDQISDAAHAAARKLQSTADYIRQTDLRGMAEEVKGLVKRYPGQSLAVAAALGFLLARGLRGHE